MIPESTFTIEWGRKGSPSSLWSLEFTAWDEEDEIEIRKTLGGMRAGLEIEGYWVKMTKKTTNEEKL